MKSGVQDWRSDPVGELELVRGIFIVIRLVDQ